MTLDELRDLATARFGDRLEQATPVALSEFLTELQPMLPGTQAGGAIEAPAASPGQGFPLRQESLDGGSKKRTKRDAIEWLMKTRGVSRKAAERVWTLALLKERKTCQT